MQSIKDEYQGDIYWPFPVSEEDRQSYELAEKIEFLESIYSDGFKAYWALPEQSIYGASSPSRSGMIVQRGRKNKWEFRLDENLKQTSTAFVDDFKVASKALRGWLNGQTLDEILEEIKDNLTLLPGLKTSYTIYRAEENKEQ